MDRERKNIMNGSAECFTFGALAIGGHFAIVKLIEFPPTVSDHVQSKFRNPPFNKAITREGERGGGRNLHIHKP